ncbi:MAG: DUF5711 family protein [Lachnospiraceae bacterium]|nr:DUF5711 family protein [Lachnospiraceae bacterium]
MATLRKIEGGAGDGSIGIREQISYHRRKNFYRFLLMLVVIAVVALIVYNQYQAHVYTGYDVADAAPLESVNAATDIRLGGSVLTYSEDGAHCTDAKGTVLWNQTFQIQDIKLAVNGTTAVIASYNGRDVYVLGEQSVLGSFQTTMPIKNVTVSQTGRVTATVSDGSVTWINTYEPDGTMIYSGQTHMSNSGYPAAMALSPSGSLLMVSFLYLDAGTVKTTLAFYNFGEVGENYTDYLVSFFNYTDEIVPEVGFISDGAAYAVSDRRIMLFQGLERPTSASEEFYTGEIFSVHSGDGFVGVVLPSDKSEHRYRMNVYNSAAKTEGVYYFDMDYRGVLFEKDGFLIYNEKECEIRTFKDQVKFDGEFQSSVNIVLPTAHAYRYVLVTKEELQTVQLN